MRVSTNFVISVATLLFGFLLVPRGALADTVLNCPTEPASNVHFASGETFAGTNCTLHTDGDIDSYLFYGTTGETLQLVAAINGAAPTDMCMTLYNPSNVQIFSGCTNISFQGYSVVTEQKLTATGTYTTVITEASSATLNYAVSLERLYPFPLNAQAVPKLGGPVTGDIKPLTDSDAWTFTSATTGTYRVTANVTSTNADLCMTVYFSNFTVAGSGCSNLSFQGTTIQIDYTPTSAEAGTNMAFLQVSGNDSTATYTLEVSCLTGKCPALMPPPPPPCTLSDVLSYNATTGTLTMNFTVGNNLGASANWSTWLTYADPQGANLDTMQTVFSQLQPITNPNKAITKTVSISKEGTVGVLSTLSTPHLSSAKTEGIACSSWVQINTGTEQ